MAELITVFSCDDCESIIGLKTAGDWKRFEETWIDSMRHQFCASCKNKTANRAVIETDLLTMANLVMQPESEETKPEFIN